MKRKILLLVLVIILVLVFTGCGMIPEGDPDWNDEKEIEESVNYYWDMISVGDYELAKIYWEKLWGQASQLHIISFYILRSCEI